MIVNSHYMIRKAAIDDVNSLSELFIEFTGQKFDTTNTKKQIEMVSQNPCYYVAVACDGDKVIGTAMAIVCYDLVGDCNSYMLIENVVVLSDYRGKGIGKLLMQSLEDFGRENNCSYVILVSGSQRSEAHKFYQSIGYEKHAGFKKRLSSRK
ncbi:GNAT family N-acetyltransferase [Paenibacillus eucommiae]|uniref:GNAT superfamily N-acetyltransferase n=1 Tax=Paenibacillus eucommiae TaxID=1355755 RepID=A0ABS4J1R4_9BACL|nr:GNAT family N-acetyltransferase [Paenibacillus eucommiae]MBP1993753.1 GNAT superfamily N-acetyltransferase [Paenibacillus eucommiae]